MGSRFPVDCSAGIQSGTYLVLDDFGGAAWPRMARDPRRSQLPRGADLRSGGRSV
jgi:hypothetical protein